MHITKHKTRPSKKPLKLDGLVSINTTPDLNPFCNITSRAPGTVCEKCYAIRLLKGFRSDCVKPFNENTKLLTAEIINWDELPRVASMLCRFHSYGELISSTHYLNFMQIAAANPRTQFSLLTKRSDIVRHNKGTIPENVTITLSTMMVGFNPFVEPPTPFHKVFAVYNRRQAMPSWVFPCPKKCIDCQACYDRRGPKIIGEYIR